MSDDKQAAQEMTKSEIIQALEGLTQEPGFLYTLVLVLRQDFFLDPEESVDINWRERLSFQEAAFLAGLMVKNSINLSYVPTENDVQKQVSKIYSLFEKLHLTHMTPFVEKMKKSMEKPITTVEEANRAYREFFGSGELMSEPIFYGGSGAYDFQYLEFAVKKYENDKEWIQRDRGIDVSTMAQIARELKKLQEHKVITFPEVKTYEDRCRATLDIFSFSKEDLEQFSCQELDSFLESFVITPGHANEKFESLGAYNEIESHPIIAIAKNLFFLPINFILTQSIYESPFYWMSSDERYKEIAFKHRGEVTEDIAYEMLIGVFGHGNVHKNVKVYKNKRELLTDIDVLAVAGNKAVIVQAKSKRLTELSKEGNEEKLRADFKDAVQNAYNQGLICRAAVIDKSNILVSDDGEELKLSEYIDDAYILCLTTDHYQAVTHQLDIYLEKKLDDPYPIAMSILALDIVLFYLRDPFELLYYFRQRVATSGHFKAHSEIAILAFHLRHKLYPKPDTDREMIDEDLAQLIDANFPVMKGHYPKIQAMEKLHHQWKNEKFQQLVEQIKSSNDIGFTDAVFYLYDIAGEGADNLIQGIEQTKQKTLQDGQQHDITFIFQKGKSGITFLSKPDSSEILGKHLLTVAMSRKYKSRADLWLGLGAVANSPNFVDVIVFNKQPWEEDRELERISRIALKQGTQLKPDRKKIGRNDPCYCGSGKKFKKCCGK